MAFSNSRAASEISMKTPGAPCSSSMCPATPSFWLETLTMNAWSPSPTKREINSAIYRNDVAAINRKWIEYPVRHRGAESLFQKAQMKDDILDREIRH